MNKIIALCLGAAGFVVLPVASASAREAPVSAATTSTAPSIVRINETVVTTRTVHHRRYRTVRRRVRRHGSYVTVTRRVYY